jgi:hypothetical protein
VGLHEGTEKVLAVADHTRATYAGDAHRFDARVRRGALRVHVVLTSLVSIRGSEENTYFGGSNTD